MKLIHKHLSMANVLSCLALFVALSGAAVAATGLGTKTVKARNLANGSVTTLKLRGGSVTTPKLREGAVRTPQLRDEAVTEDKLRNRSVGGNKIARGAITDFQLAPDAVGFGKILDGSITEKEISGALIAQIFRNLSYVSATSDSNTSATKSVSAECPFSKLAISGGARVVGNNTGVAITGSVPNLGIASDTRSWGASAQAIGTQTDPWAIQTFAVCAELRVP